MQDDARVRLATSMSREPDNAILQEEYARLAIRDAEAAVEAVAMAPTLADRDMAVSNAIARVCDHGITATIRTTLINRLAQVSMLSLEELRNRYRIGADLRAPPSKIGLVRLKDVDASMPLPMLFGQRLPVGYTTTIYGAGGQGKSFLAMAIGIAMAQGIELVGLGVGHGPVLYADWELSAEEQARRATRVARGYGLAGIPADFMYCCPGAPIGHMAKELAATIARHEVKLCIIDSMGPACGHAPEDASGTIEAFNSIKTLGCTVLLLDHQSKIQMGQTYGDKLPFGSVYKENLARSIVQVEKLAYEIGLLKVRLKHRKSNFGPLTIDMDLAIRFTGEAVRFERAVAEPGLGPGGYPASWD